MSWWQIVLDWLRRVFAPPPSPPSVPPVEQPPVVDPPPDPVPPVVAPPVVVPPVHRFPSEVLNLASWKLTLPVKDPEKASPRELLPAELVRWEDPSWFHTTPDGTGVVFRAPVNGYTTSGSSYPRSELREMNADGSLASWASTDGKTHTVIIDQAFTHLPNDKPHVVGGQIHDGSNDITVFRLEGQSLWVTDGDTKVKLVTDNYQLGTRFEAKFVVYAGAIQAFYNGELVHTISRAGAGWYAKAGCYTQANASNSKPADESNYGEVQIFGVSVTHGGQLAPDPAPAPAPATVAPIMIIRHGEKSSDANDHTLSPQGVQRANALPPLFTTPRADLYRPSWVFASKGNTSSMRMLQTAQPTATALGLPIDTSLDTENAVSQTAALLVAQAKAGQVVLAVLEHSAIPATLAAVAKLLGTTGKVLTSYPSDRFDLGFAFVGKTYREFNEAVLPGDTGYVAPK